MKFGMKHLTGLLLGLIGGLAPEMPVEQKARVERMISVFAKAVFTKDEVFLALVKPHIEALLKIADEYGRDAKLGGD